VAVLQALRSVGAGAGQVVDRYERVLFGRARPDDEELRDGEPLTLLERTIPTEWIDYNGHTNDSRYLELSSRAVDAFMRFIGVNEAYLTGGHSYFTVESHLTFVEQTHAGDRVRVEVVLLSHDEKRFHVFTSTVRREDDGSDTLIGTAEHLLLHVDTVANRAAPAEAAVLDRLAAVAAAHAGIPRPPAAGRHVGQPR
jgi:carnitine 3-dehydrogenase